MSPRVLFEQDLETLKNKVSEMGEHAEISYDHMLYGIRENKEDILKTLLDTDHKMVDMQRSIEAMCLSLLTRQQPVARDMRLVSAALKVVTDQAAAMEEGEDQARFYHSDVVPAMEALRAPVDKLEMLVDKSMWPMPSYGDLIFEV